MINKIFTFDTKELRLEIAKGIDLFIAKHKEKHNLNTDYALEKKAGLCDNTINNIRKSGNCKLDTLYKLGRAVGIKPNKKSKSKSKGVIIKVLRDMEVI